MVRESFPLTLAMIANCRVAKNVSLLVRSGDGFVTA
jgi:hypothetical protein